MTTPLADADLLDRVRRRLVADVPALVGADRLLDATALAGARREVEGEIHGVGLLQPLIDRPGVTDVLVNGPREVWVEQAGVLHRAPVVFADDAAVRRLAVRLAVAAGRRLDDASPWVDAALPGGIRLHAVIPPLVASTTVSLRVLRPPPTGPPGASWGLAAHVLAVLRAAVVTGLGLLIVGPTGAGKTTLLASLLGEVPAAERIVIVEDTAELAVSHPHVVRLVTRAPNVEGVGGVDLDVLVRQAMRMRPDRLVVGEFRGSETGVLLGALTSGHRGAATMHASGVAGVPARLLALGALSGLTPASVAALAAVAFDVVVTVQRSGADRRVGEIGLLHTEAGAFQAAPVWTAAAGPLEGWAELGHRVVA